MTETIPNLTGLFNLGTGVHNSLRHHLCATCFHYVYPGLRGCPVRDLQSHLSGEVYKGPLSWRRTPENLGCTLTFSTFLWHASRASPRRWKSCLRIRITTLSFRDLDLSRPHIFPMYILCKIYCSSCVLSVSFIANTRLWVGLFAANVRQTPQTNVDAPYTPAELVAYMQVCEPNVNMASAGFSDFRRNVRRFRSFL